MNTAMESALMLRGLRAMDAALGEFYNVNSHMCIPSPVVYPDTFPEAGINFSKFSGLEGLKGIWRGWMYESGTTNLREGKVHPDVEETVVEAFDILENCDKSKDGVITTSEWETCQKGKSATDTKWDLDYLTALHNVTAKMLMLEKDQPLNPADPNTYPELIQSRNDFATLKTDKEKEVSNLTTELERSREDVSLYQTLTCGLGGALGVVALALGVRAALRKGGKKDDKKPTVKPAGTPPPLPQPQAPVVIPPAPAAPARVEVAIENKAAPQPAASAYEDVLSNIEAQAPADNVLAALAEDEAAAVAAAAEAEKAEAKA